MKLLKNFRIFYISGTNPWIKKINFPRILKKSLKSSSIVIYYVFNNNFFYTQLAFAFVSQKDSYCALFFFFFSKILISISGLFSFFIPFFFRRILIFNRCFFSEYFFVFVDNIYISFLLVFSIYFKNYVSYVSILWMTENHSKCLNIKTKHILYLVFFSRIFFMSIFSIGIRRYFYSISYLLKHLFFFNSMFTFF